MTIDWYRSESGPPREPIKPSASRRIRNWLRRRLPDPDVRDRVIVLHARQAFPRRSAWAGLFSEFHSVLGALAYAERRGAAGVRVDFRSPLYLDASRGPNWWTYYFEPDDMRIAGRTARGEIHLDRVAAKYGRHGGFCDEVNGVTPYLYPMTYGIDRTELHRLATAYLRVRDDIRAAAERWIAASFDPSGFVVGVHYRGTDSTRGPLARVLDYRDFRVPYESYAAEAEAVLERRAPRAFQVAVATDEADFVHFMRRRFGSRVICVESSPRAKAGGPAIHLDATLPVSNYEKGRSAVIDALLLSATHYLVKGRSNVSDASLVFNPRLPYSFCVH